MYITADTTMTLHMYIPDKEAKKYHFDDPEGGSDEGEVFWEKVSKEREEKIKELLWKNFCENTDFFGEADEDKRWFNKEYII